MLNPVVCHGCYEKTVAENKGVQVGSLNKFSLLTAEYNFQNSFTEGRFWCTVLKCYVYVKEEAAQRLYISFRT